MEGIGGAIVIKNLTDGNTLVFNVGRVSSGSLNSPDVSKKIIFLEKEAYTRDFNLCIGEGANSTEECYLRIIELTINNNDGLSITYGVGGSGTGTKENHEIVQKNLETIFDENQNIFDEMLNTVELVEKQ